MPKRSDKTTGVVLIAGQCSLAANSVNVNRKRQDENGRVFALHP
jgi:hypothetical protein